MPNFTFVLPHWLYWSGLVVLPLVALWLVKRQERQGPPRTASLPIGYLLLVAGGFVGLHRFYVRSLWGFVYIPLFLGILYGNAGARDARVALSDARDELSIARFEAERLQEQAAQGIEGAAEQLVAAKDQVVAAQDQLAAAAGNFAFWNNFSGAFALGILVLLVIDAVLLPRLVGRCAASEGAVAPPRRTADVVSPPARSRVSRLIDTLNAWAGNFVCYWCVIAVFVYYYEVIFRYVFNAPTNWAHETMFLMFGMMYLLAGGFALREDAHVRVDVIYVHLSARTRAAVDVFSSLFFFIFTVTLLISGWTFFKDSLAVWEESFSEYHLQYWPVKATIPLGAVLIILQGLSKLISDVRRLVGKEA